MGGCCGVVRWPRQFKYINYKLLQRQEESVKLFRESCDRLSSQRSLPVILFLNKHDLFVQKLPYFPLHNYNKYMVPEDSLDSEKASNCVYYLYRDCLPDSRTIFHHVTTAVDTNCCAKVWSDLRARLWSESISRYAL
eukprot:TRINITY_DN6525_c0_g2_i10.p1 TRINITY_DN6525_c0_g2~~TRINITY_DN6525_c0_g2_i10.p1  ORF type:complete len:137 (-),score=9.91 TRINITY_DN6525_c0_g2_i10:180-590(-)